MDDALGLSLEHLARAADLCLPPWRHGVRLRDSSAEECTVWIEARDADGERQPQHDLELEIYRSGRDLHLMLSRLANESAPLLWHGNHPVWLRADSGARCAAPADGAELEALCRRLRALLAPG